MNILLTDVPHQGQVVAQYRRAKNWSQEDLADALRVDVRTVQRMEQQHMIKSVERRRLLVGLLGIPLALMGLESEQELTKLASLVINQDRMAFFENELAARWDLYHTGGTFRAGRNLDVWIREITDFARMTQGTGWYHRSLALLSMSYQLQICTARDMLDFAQAHKAAQKAYQIAKELDDPELIAATLAHDGIAYLQQDRPLEAIKYLNGGLKNVHYAGLAGLRSYILQAISEAYAKARQPQESWQSIGLAERALEQRDSRQERGKTHLYASSTLAQKGINAVLLEDHDRALVLIEKGLTSYNPTFVRGRARLSSQKAEALYGSGLIDESVAAAEEAIQLARSVGSHKTIARVQTLHGVLSQSRWRKERSIARLGALLSL